MINAGTKYAMDHNMSMRDCINVIPCSVLAVGYTIEEMEIAMKIIPGEDFNEMSQNFIKSWFEEN